MKVFNRYILLFFVFSLLIAGFGIKYYFNTSNMYYTATTHITVDYSKKTDEPFLNKIKELVMLRLNRDYNLVVHTPNKDYEYFSKLTDELNIDVKLGFFNKDEIIVSLVGNDYNTMRICKISYNLYNLEHNKDIITDVFIHNEYYYNKLNSQIYNVLEHILNIQKQKLLKLNNKTDNL